MTLTNSERLILAEDTLRDMERFKRMLLDRQERTRITLETQDRLIATAAERVAALRTLAVETLA